MSHMEPDFPDSPPPLERWQAFLLYEVMGSWVERIQFPDRPFIAYQGLDFATPRQLLEAVGDVLRDGDSPLGRRYLYSVRVALTEIPFETFIAGIERSGAPRSRLLRRLLEAYGRAMLRLRGRRNRDRAPLRG